MKKYFWGVFVLLFLNSAVYAQLSLRPQVGINFTSFSEDLLDGEWSSQVGYQIGVDLQIGGTLYVQPGINYQSNRLSFEDAEEVDFSMNRINIPVLVGFRLFEPEGGKAFGLRAYAGPNFAIHTGEDIDDSLSGLSSDDFNDAQVGLLAGAGLDLSILFVDLMYKFGLGNTIEIENLNEDTNVNIFMLNAGIRLGF